MRILPLLAVAAVSLTLLAGCSSKPDVADASLPVPGEGAEMAAAAAVNQTKVQLQFAGGYKESDLPVAETFAPTDLCTFSSCPERPIDLAAVAPADVPVELSVVLSVNSNFGAYLDYDPDEVSIVQYSTESSSGTIAIDALLVRSGAGALQLVIVPEFPSFDALAAGPSVTGNVHSVVRASVVPAYVPVAVQLGPGEVLNATGDGLEQLVAYAPDGSTVRDTTKPFGLAIPDGAPTGTYILFVVADEAVRLLGPDRTLTAHRLVFMETEPVDLASGQPSTWEMPIPGLPVEVGVALESKETVPDCCSAASYLGPRTIGITAPGNVAILTEETDCLPLMGCPFTPLGRFSWWYGSEFLDEHLVPGTYAATVTPDQANNAQAFSWAVYIV